LKFNKKKNDKQLVEISSPKSDPYIFLDAALLWQPHRTVAYYGYVQTDSYFHWAQMEGLKINVMACI